MKAKCEFCRKNGDKSKMGGFNDDGAVKYIHDTCAIQMIGEDVIRNRVAGDSTVDSVWCCLLCGLTEESGQSMASIFKKDFVGGLYIHDACISKKLKAPTQ